MGLCTRYREGRDVTGLRHHTDKGVQYVAVHYTQRLAEAGAVARSARPAIPTTTPWPKRSTRCSRPNSSATAAPGEASTISRSPPPNTSTGSTTDACTPRSAWSHRPSSRTTTTGTTPPRLPSERQFRASTELDTRHRHRHQLRPALDSLDVHGLHSEEGIAARARHGGGGRVNAPRSVRHIEVPEIDQAAWSLLILGTSTPTREPRPATTDSPPDRRRAGKPACYVLTQRRAAAESRDAQIECIRTLSCDRYQSAMPTAFSTLNGKSAISWSAAAAFETSAS